jgi:polyhydroxybutyrate depolymerase
MCCLRDQHSELDSVFVFSIRGGTKMKIFRAIVVGVFVLAFTVDCGGRARGRSQSPDPVPGLQHGTLQSGGLQRSYYVSLPAGASGRMPLVVVLHGGRQNGPTIARMTEMHELGQRARFAVAYPEAYGEDRVWNDGRGNTQSQANDVVFIDDLVADLSSRYPIDPNKVYIVGPSNGGMFTLRLACERANKFRAFAVIAANFPADYVSRCNPGRPVPIEFFHGTDDRRLMPWNGGDLPGGGKVISAADTVRFWVQNNGCSAAPQETALPDASPNDGTRVTRVAYSSCRNSSEVTHFVVQGGGHTWPGSPVTPTLRISGAVSLDIRATDTVWAFFQKY